MRRIILYSFVLTIVFFSCKKEDPNWRKNAIDLSAVDIEQTTELSAIVRYSMKVSGNPLPEIMEFGLIVSADPEAPFFGERLPSAEPSEKENYEQILSNLEGGTKWYIRAYAVTSRDTVLGEINTFSSGKYYTEGLGVTDVEGNFYRTVKIGNQEWMAQNLISRTFCNGDTLVLANSPDVLSQYGDSVPITFNYQFAANVDTAFGKYYQGMVAFDDRNICPCGWRIPRKSDIVELANFVGNNQYLGGKMKAEGIREEGTGLWRYPNALGNNLTGLSIQPGGYYWRGVDFQQAHSLSQTMIIETISNNWGNPIEMPSSFLLQFIRRHVEFQTIGMNGYFVGIRCIKE